MLTDILRKYQGERSLREYARLLGVDHSTLSVVFNTHRQPSTFILAALSRTFPESANEIAAALVAQEPAALPLIPEQVA